MNRARVEIWRAWVLLACCALPGALSGAFLGVLPGVAMAEVIRQPGVDLANRPISEIRVEGVKEVPERLVLNQVRLRKGDAYDPQVVEQDIIRLTHLGRFSSVQARVEANPDGSVVLTYLLEEQKLLSDVQVVGNKALDDQRLLGLVVLRAGDPVDPYLIDRAVRQIKAEYERAGFFSSDVSVDQDVLNQSSILLFRVREGPKVKVKGIRFEGNQAYSSDELQSKIFSKTHIIIFRDGSLSREKLDADAARLRDFYRDRGYLDAQVGRRIDLSPNQKDAVVVFFVEEGARFTVDQVRVEGATIFTEAQITQALSLHPGDIFSLDQLRISQRAVVDLYGKLGFIETTVAVERLFHENAPRVDLLVKITEHKPYLVGKVTISGNQLTQDKVVYRQVRGIRPGRRFDRAGIGITEQRLRESALFEQGNITILGDPNDDYRDVLIEVKEKNTGSLSFGAGISSDAGILGAINLTQRNFDIGDWPESFGEFFTGKAFRGAGQFFSLNVEPGNERSIYSVNFRDPYLLDTDYFLDTRGFFFNRERRDYDEERLGGTVGLGQRFGDVWSASIVVRGEQIDISSIDEDAATDVFDVEGGSTITAIGFLITRTTTDSRVFPTQGSNIQLGISQAGALGGDYDFTRASLEVRKFWTVDEDFFGRRTVLSARLEAGYLFNEAPIFERFYAGGHRSFRGFDFRGIGPRGVDPDGEKTDDSIGGDWLFLLGLEYNFPIYQEVIRGVIFTDTGTLEESFGFSEYRVSVGAGIRLRIPFLGQAPFALDFAIPLVKQDDDITRVFSFDLALPF